MDIARIGHSRLQPRRALSLAAAQVHRSKAVMLAVPLGTSALVSIAGVVLAHLAGREAASLAMMLIVQLYPISVGACAVVALGDDLLAELQESTFVGFRAVQLARLAVMLAGGVIGACLLFAVLHAFGVFPNDIGWLSALSPVGGAAIVVLVAYTAVSLTGSVRSAIMAVIAVMIFLTLFWDLQVPNPIDQRQGPLLVACTAAAIAWFASGRSERLLERAGGNAR